MGLPLHASRERDYITMMRTMTVVRQYLAAALLLVIGLIAYGCGDSATVNPEATLANLSVTTDTATITLQPSFNPATTSYTADLSNNVTTVTVSAQPAVSGDNVTINGQVTTNRVIDLGPPVPAGSTTLVSITVSDPPNTPKTYTVLLRRAALEGNNSLQSLTVSPGALAPTFNANTQTYTVDVANTVGSVTVTPTLQDTAATMTVNGQATNSGQARTVNLNPAGQSTSISIAVTAQNGNLKTYTVTASRGISSNNNLQGLTVSPGPLSPTYNANRASTSYTVNVGSTVANITVTPTRQDPNATITMNGTPATSGQGRSIPLNGAGSNTVINIVVTAQNGTQKTYSINVVRAALGGNNNLSALTVSPGSLNSAFDPDDQTYTVNVASTVASITVTPTRQDPAATLTVTSNGPGPITTSGQARTIPLRAAGLSTTITIVVRAQNGSEKPYTITVDRAAPPPPSGNNNLRNLTVSPGTLSPAFSATRTRTDYAVNDVGSSITSILVTATPEDSSATVTINGQGGNSRSIPLPTGPSTTEIDILVRALNGNEKPYSITVNQPAPAVPQTPTVAPDLLREDDTCPTGIPPDECAPDFNGNPTSREDNVTTVTTPRFSIPQPGSGETATLYINGSKDVSSSTTGNLLRPSTSLSDGTYTITYTLSNSGGESNESPALTPQLRVDTTGP